MHFIKKTSLIMAMFGLVFLSSIAVQAQTTTSVKWVEAKPDKTHNQKDANILAKKLLAQMMKDYYDVRPAPTLYAQFFNAPGLPENSFIIARLDGKFVCGTMGCPTFLIKKSASKKNSWRIVVDTLANSVISSTLKAPERARLLCTKGTAESSYKCFDTVLEKHVLQSEAK